MLRARLAQPIQQHAVPADVRPDIERHVTRTQVHVLEQVARDHRLVRAQAVDVARDDIGAGPGEGEVERCGARLT